MPVTELSPLQGNESPPLSLKDLMYNDMNRRRTMSALAPHAFDAYGDPVRDLDPGYFTALGASLAQGPLLNKGTNGFLRVLLNSGAEWAASRDITQVKTPVNMDPDGNIITPSGSMTPSGEALWEGMHPAQKHLIEKMGFTKDDYKDLDYDKAVEKYQFQVTMSNLQEVLAEYDHGFAVGAGSFVTSILTDPASWAIALVSGGAGAVAKSAAGRVLTTPLRNTAAGLVWRSGMAIPEGKMISPMARHVLIHGSNFSIGAADAALRQYASNETLLRYNMEAPDFDWRTVGIGGLGALALGGVLTGAFHGLGKAAEVTNQTVKRLAMGSTDLSAGALLSERAIWFRNFRSEFHPELDSMELADKAEQLIYSIYGDYGVTLFREAVSLGRYDEVPALDNLVNRLLSRPSDDLFISELAGDLSIVRTDLEIKLDKLMDLHAQINRVQDPNVYKKLKREETDLQGEIEVYRAELVKKISSIEKDEVSKEIVDPRVRAVLERIRDDLGSRPQINANRLNAAAQAKVIDHLGDAAKISNQRVYLGTVPKILRDTVGRVVTSASELGTGKGSIRAGEKNNPVLAALAQLVDPWGYHQSAIDPSKGMAPSLSTQYIRGRRKANKEVIGVWNKLRKTVPVKDHNKLLIESFQVAGKAKTSDNKVVNEMARAWRGYFDSMGLRGIKNGALSSFLDDYLPIYISSDLLQRAGGAPMLAEELWQYYLSRFASDDIQELHLKTWWGMLKSEHVQARIQEMGFSPDDLQTLYALITKKEHLKAFDEDLYYAYIKALESPDGVLAKDAEDSISRRLGYDDRELHEMNDAGFDGAPRLLPDERRARQIEQEFWLQSKFLEQGIVKYEPSAVLSHYIARGGFRILEQESINALTGMKSIGWSGIERWMDNLGAKDPEIAAMADFIKTKRNDIRGVRQFHEEDGLRTVFQPGMQLGRAAVQAGTGLSASVESFLQMASMVMAPEHWGTIMATIMRNLSNETMETLGRTLPKIRRQHRFVPDFNVIGDSDFGYTFGERLKHTIQRPWLTMQDPKRYPSSSPSKGRVAQTVTSVADSISEFSHLMGGEESMTDFARTLGYTDTLVRMRKNHKKLLTAHELLKNHKFSKDADAAAKEFKGIARKAGFSDPTELAAFIRNFGDRWEVNIRTLAELKDSGFKDWQRLEKYQELIMAETDPDRKARLNEFLNSLMDVMDENVRFVSPEATVSDYMLRNDSVFSEVAMMFTTFSRAFASKKLSRLANSPLTRAVPYLMFNVFLEAALMNFRATLYGGMSRESIAEKWEEDPYRMMGLALARVPWVGPWTDIVASFANNLVSENKYDTFDGSMLGGMMNDLMSVTQKGIRAIYDEEAELSTREQKALNRYMPIWNLPYIRLIERTVEGFEDQNE